MCPWSLVIGGTRDRLLELVVRPAQRYRATGSPDFAIDKYGGTTRRRRLSCADDHGGAGAILRKGFDLPNHRYESALVELADAVNGVARHTTIQAWIIRRSCLSVGGEPLLDREIVASTVKHRKPSIPATNCDGLPVVRISTSGRGVMTTKYAAAITNIAPHQRNGVRNKHTSNSPAVPASNGPVPKGGMRPTAPGSADTHRATRE